MQFLFLPYCCVAVTGKRTQQLINNDSSFYLNLLYVTASSSNSSKLNMTDLYVLLDNFLISKHSLKNVTEKEKTTQSRLFFSSKERNNNNTLKKNFNAKIHDSNVSCDSLN